MKYFTRAWATGNLSDAEHSTVLASYQHHIRRITQFLPDPVAVLAREISLHDAMIRRVCLDLDQASLQLELICGDMQAGYFDIDLLYRGVDWSGVDRRALARCARDPDADILYDEVDHIADAVYEHRLLFWPEDEIAIRFNDLTIRRVARVGRETKKIDEPYSEIGGRR